MERRLTAIMAADVVGYSHLIRTDEEGTLAAFNALRAEFEPEDYNSRQARAVSGLTIDDIEAMPDAFRRLVRIHGARPRNDSR